MKFNKLDNTVKGRIIPRFKLKSPEKIETIVSLIEKNGDKDSSINVIKLQNRFLRITVPQNEQHYWSPVLKITCDDLEMENNTIIRGHIGPNESVWGIFFLTYAAIGVIGLFGGLWAYAQWLIEKNSSYIIIIPICLLLFSTLFITSKIGQKKAHSQMIHIMRFLRKAIDTIDCERML